MPTDRKLRVAIVHDWLVSYRGGEQVLDAICELFPTAEIFTLFYERGSVGPVVERHPVHASFLNRLPLARRTYRHWLPLMPLAIESFSFHGFDLVISSSHCVAKGVIVPPGVPHLAYCHTPMRYAWDRYDDYFGGRALEPFIRPFLHYLRMWDVTSSARVDRFVANSSWTRERIRKYYRRDADVVNPFVDLETFRPVEGEKDDYYLVVSAFAPYKRIDLAIEACKSLERPLVIVGDGQDSSRLKKMSGKGIEFRSGLRGAELRDTYAKAKALLFPGEEDFGIVPLEAMASGTPIIGYGRGGLLDSVLPGETAWLFFEQTGEALARAIAEFEAAGGLRFADCRSQAEKFSRVAFQHGLMKSIAQLTAGSNSFAMDFESQTLRSDA